MGREEDSYAFFIIPQFQRCHAQAEHHHLKCFAQCTGKYAPRVFRGDRPQIFTKCHADPGAGRWSEALYLLQRLKGRGVGLESPRNGYNE